MFLKLKGRLLNNRNKKDKLLFTCAQRANLDAFCSRSSSTVGNNLQSVKRILKLANELGLKGPFFSLGPMPSHDHFGYKVAVKILLYSTKPGRHSKEHMQFNTIRHSRTCVLNFERISLVNCSNNLTFPQASRIQGDIGHWTMLSTWFRRFSSSCKLRMDQTHKPNLALTTRLIVLIL